MPAPSVSSRKLLIDLKYETQKLYAWLNTLNHFDHTPKTALVWAHMASFIQTTQGIITCARHKQYVAVAPLVRVAGDCVVNCNLLIAQCSDDNAVMSAWMEKRKFVNIILNQARKAYTDGEIQTAEQYKAETERKIDALDADDKEYYYDMTFQERWKAFDEEQAYHTIYSPLSSEVHSNPEALDRRHADMVDGIATLFWCKYEEEEAQALLRVLCLFLSWTTPCFQYLSDALDPNADE